MPGFPVAVVETDRFGPTAWLSTPTSHRDALNGQREDVTAAARPRIRDQVAENPLASFLGAVIIVMLGFTLTTSYDCSTRLEDKIDTRFAQVDARFDSLESDVGEINWKLTALIAALNATDPVDAALEGRLTGTATAVPADEPR